MIHALDAEGRPQAIDLVLDRPPEREAPLLSRPQADRSPHALRIRGAARGFLVEADGVRVAYLADPSGVPLAGPVDVLIGAGLDRPGVEAKLQPRLSVPLDAPAASGGTRRPPGNTIALAAAGAPAQGPPQVAMLDTVPWTMPPELADLFERKERAARAAAEVFAPLSASQMSHRPADGTHTPRWNAEHMMARELGFFTGIYAGRQEGFPHLDLNPAQMPLDYQPAHPGWSGAEEARQIERVQALVRRFAYLLEGLDLDERPPGSPWTLRRLLDRMDGHYREHTAHVRAKLEQPDWPALRE